MTAKEKQAAKNKAYHEANREKCNAASRAWRAANPERVAALNRAYEAANPGIRSKNMLAWQKANKKKWNEYQRGYAQRRREEAAGRPKPDFCEACDGPPTKIGLVFDHSHLSGAFRGWICHHCNVALGHVRDSQWRLRALIDYLDRNEGPRELAA